MEQSPTGVSMSLLEAHTGSSNQLSTAAIEVGALGTLLDVFEDDIKQLIEDELEELGIDLN